MYVWYIKCIVVTNRVLQRSGNKQSATEWISALDSHRGTQDNGEKSGRVTTLRLGLHPRGPNLRGLGRIEGVFQGGFLPPVQSVILLCHHVFHVTLIALININYSTCNLFHLRNINNIMKCRLLHLILQSVTYCFKIQ